MSISPRASLSITTATICGNVGPTAGHSPPPAHLPPRKIGIVRCGLPTAVCGRCGWNSWAELIADLPIDGIWLDFIRWPARWEKQPLSLYDSSFDQETLSLFAQECNIDLPAAPVADRSQWILAEIPQKWIDWRCSVIERFVEDAVDIVRRQLPEARIGLFTVPWTGDPLVDRSDVADANHRIVGQNLTRLGRHVDVISPMVYHHLCGRPVEWIETIGRYAVGKSQASIWPVIEAIDPPAQYPAAEFAAALSTAQNAGSQNVIIFKLDGLLADPEKQIVLTIKNRSPRGKG